MKIGIQMYTLRDYMKTPEDLDTTLKKVAEMGYKSVQITPPGFTTAEKLAEQLKGYGLSADSAMCSLAKIPENIDKIVADAKALGTDVLRTDSILPEWRTGEEGYHIAAAHLEKCGKLLHEKGLKFMYHFHSFEYIKLGDTRGIDILLAETSPEYVMFQPDVFWLTAAGCEPSTELRRYVGRVKYMHLKDYVIVPSGTDTLEVTKRASAPVGTGNLNWDSILFTAKALGVENFVVEDDMGVLSPFDSAKQSIDNLQKLLF